METTYVYLIQKGYAAIKIGVSSDPERRRADLQTGNHGPLYLIAKFPFQNRAEALDMERALHDQFADERLSSEWFHKRILRKFTDRARLFPQIFKSRPSGALNSYHRDPPCRPRVAEDEVP